MKRLRFSIAALLAFVLTCGLGLAALKSASGMWASVMVTVAAVALLTSIVGAAKGRNRAGWFGFAVFGWGYVAVNFAPGCQDVIQPHLLTTLAIVESYRHVHPILKEPIYGDVRSPGQLPAPTQEPGGISLLLEEKFIYKFAAVPGVGPAKVVTSGPGQFLVVYGPGAFPSYVISGHAMLTVLTGLLGGFIASLVAERRPEGER